MSNNKGLLTGRRGLIMGVANNRSIAWGIAKSCADQGAELAFTYQGDALKKRVEPLAAEVSSKIVVPCDVTDTASIDATFSEIEKSWGKLDFLVHAIAFADKNELEGRYVDTTAGNFDKSLNISCYSFTAVAQRAETLMTNGGSIISMTYYGAEKAVPHYNVMGVAKAALESSVRYLAADLGVRGIRVNTLSPGPINTISARGVSGLHEKIKHVEEVSPLKRPFGQEECGTSAVYLCSDLSKGVTGQVIYIDSGYNIVAL